MIDGCSWAKGGFGFHATHDWYLRNSIHRGKMEDFPDASREKPTRGWFVAVQLPLTNEDCPMHWL